MTSVKKGVTLFVPPHYTYILIYKRLSSIIFAKWPCNRQIEIFRKQKNADRYPLHADLNDRAE